MFKVLIELFFGQGLTSNLYIGNNRLINWTMVPLPLTNEEEFTKAMLKLKISKHLENIHHEVGKAGQSSGYYLSNADEPSTKKMFRKTLDYIQKLFSTEDQMDSDSLLKVPRSIHRVSEKSQSYSESMAFYEGTLDISASENEPRDTFLKLDGWTKVRALIFPLVQEKKCLTLQSIWLKLVKILVHENFSMLPFYFKSKFWSSLLCSGLNEAKG